MRFFTLACSVFLLSFCGFFFYLSSQQQPQTAAVEPAVPQPSPILPGMPDKNAPAHTLPLFPQVSVKSELLERRRVPNYVMVLLINSDFRKLEELAEHYRTTKARTPSGLWYLSLFHEGISRYLNTVRSRPQNLPPGKRWEGTADEMHVRIFDEWLAAYPNSPTPHLAHALRLRAQAWQIRGESYANKVPEEAWQPFHKKLMASREYLIKHREIASQDPEWYRLRISTATELGEPEELVLDTLSQAVEAEPYYYDTYFSAARHFLPKWGGDSKYISALANMAVKNTKEKDGMSLYARIYWTVVGGSQAGPLTFYNPDVSWAKMVAGMDDILRNYPDNWNINNFLYFSCMAGDRKQAKKILDQMVGEPIMSVWRDKALLNGCKDFALGLDEPVEPGSPS